jgi:toxin ParE1/3/4
MKRFKVHWTKEATIDLGEIVDYISKDRVSAAKSVYNKIKSKCRLLNESPERCRWVPELLEIGIDNYREIIVAPYRVIFKLTESAVYIFAVFDGRRDVESILFERLFRIRITKK